MVETPKIKIFISYARTDKAFATELVEGLEYDGAFTVLIDEVSIATGELFKERITALITEADTIVFILSPNFVESDNCDWEIDEAIRLSKRMLPVQYGTVDLERVRDEIRGINFVRFHEIPSFMRGLRVLANALKSDVDWIRSHTRYLERAVRWDLEGRPPDRFLPIGQDADDARSWFESRPTDAPEPTALHLDFVEAAIKAETARQNEERQRLDAVGREQEARARLQRRMFYGLGVMVVLLAVIGAIIAYLYSQNETALLKLKEGMRLKIAKTDRAVHSNEKWYRVATDYKLAIGKFTLPVRRAGGTLWAGTGFLVDGGSLSPNWQGMPVFLTATHNLSLPNDKPIQSDAIDKILVDFPAIPDSTGAHLSSVLFSSPTNVLDVSILAVKGSLPRSIGIVPFDSQASKEADIDGVAVLHWAAQTGFAIGFGHTLRFNDIGMAREKVKQIAPPEQRVFYTHVTGPGASGAPVFSTETARLICLHQSGNPNAKPAWGACTPIAKLVNAITNQSTTKQ